MEMNGKALALYLTPFTVDPASGSTDPEGENVLSCRSDNAQTFAFSPTADDVDRLVIEVHSQSVDCLCLELLKSLLVLLFIHYYHLFLTCKNATDISLWKK